MIKFIKKHLLVVTMLLIALTISACSTISKPSAESAISNATKNTKSLKSVDFTSTNSTEIISSDNTQKVENTIQGALIVDPFAMHITSKLSSGNQVQNLDLYIKDNTTYVLSTGQNSWSKSSDANIASQFENLKKLTTSDQIFDFYAKMAKDFTLSEENNNYVLSYSGSGDQFKELLVALVNASSSSTDVSGEAFDNVNFNNINIKFVVTKDYEPVSNTISLDLVAKNTAVPTSMKISQTVEYSNVNKVSDINIPDEAKNATEYSATNNN